MFQYLMVSAVIQQNNHAVLPCSSIGPKAESLDSYPPLVLSREYKHHIGNGGLQIRIQHGSGSKPCFQLL